ncbi:MAG TPA: MarR family transcriptional regulator [Candidatus Udaeobacter sp.]|jgi:MarR family transcriptional regulator for hemolysin|nr:MarR family transcriptional regulator [Candidatus Udaeobacter sp.]
MSDGEIFGQLLHGTARAWRQKLDARLKPMGLSQAKWRTLMHLSLAEDALTQAEIAGRLGVEEPSVVTLLNRLEKEGWVTRKNSARDRRCKMVLLGRRAQRIIDQINAAAGNLRQELLADIRREDLQTCINVLHMICVRAAKDEKERRAIVQPVNSNDNGHGRDRYTIQTKGALATMRKKST